MSQNGDPTQLGGWFDGWLAVLDRYRVQHLILDKERDDRLLSLVRSRPGWAVDFEDEASVLFIRIGKAEHLDTVQGGGLFSLQSRHSESFEFGKQASGESAQ
jgi:hypothetical protein